jgi:hypothetical protein
MPGIHPAGERRPAKAHGVAAADDAKETGRKAGPLTEIGWQWAQWYDEKLSK